MSKRRFQTDAAEDGSEDGSPPVSAADRRRQRKRDRLAREAGNVRSKSKGLGGWRRALVIGVPVAVIVVVVVILLVNPFQPPCLQLQSIPASSYPPDFPGHNASTDLTRSWCPPGVNPVMQVYPQLTIRIGSTTVGLPTAIGKNTNYSYQGQPYTCTLPVATHTVAEGGLPANTIYIISPWPYEYNLSTFFQVWSFSYSTVDVNASFSSQPITYTSTDLLGFSADATHTVQLWVDNHLSSAGPGLDLDTVTRAGNVYPSCLGTIYGTGHSILLTYSTVQSAAAGRAPTGAGLATGMAAHGPEPLYGSPLSDYGALQFELDAQGHLGAKSLLWLVLRADA